jgi:thiamine biosynthesis lipoprotein
MERTEVLMGMPITVVIPPSRGRPPGEDAFEAVFGSFRAVDAQFSPYKPESEVSRISRGDLRTEDASPLMREVLDLCRQTQDLTDGWFTPWFEGQFDPSGLVKGWAIHRASQLLDDLGYRDHCIEAGGDIEVRGFNDEGQPWEIGIRNPFDTSTLVKVLYLSDRGVATSGTYIRGRHIYNPKTGERIEGVPSLTVVGPNVYEADRLATPAYAMGEGGISWLATLPGIEAYQIGHDQCALATPGLAEYQR